ncbi:MAG: hypothetical protein HC914_17920 [Chloroflexaceae bacterium]|nr:hypothetical protein [Chloroflexaceae bacterium]
MEVTTEPVAYGQEIVYTVRYRNEGTLNATMPRLMLKAWGLVQLQTAEGLRSEVRVDLDDVPPGVEQVYTFTGVVADRPAVPDPATQYLGVSIYLANETRGLFDWWVVAHSVDADAPTEVAITTDRLEPGANRIRGTAIDQSGTAQITLLVQSEAGGAEQPIACPDSSPHNGQWTCPLDIGDAAIGTSFAVRVQVMDAMGFRTVSAPRLLTVQRPADAVRIFLPLIQRTLTGLR